MLAGAVYELPMLERLISETDGGFMPTPTIACATGGQTSRSGDRKGELLLTGYARMWPSPSANNYEQEDLTALLARRERIKAQGINGNGFGLTLGNAARIWPTPVQRMWKDSGSPAEYKRNEIPLAAQVGGSLSPTWVEWLMGWPLGWTVSKLSVMGRFRSKRPSHGKS